MHSEEENHWNRKSIEEENLALDKVLKHRNTGKKMPEVCSSESQNGNQSDFLKKSKLISKEQNDAPTPVTQVSSTEIARKLVFNETLSHSQIEGLMVKLKSIKSLKYDKLSVKIRQSLVQTNFQDSYPRFARIVQAYSEKINSTHLLLAIFHGFEMAWTRQKFDSIGYFQEFLKLYIKKIPNFLNKRFVQWMEERIQSSSNKSIYPNLKIKVLQYVNEVIAKNKVRKQRAEDNEKVIGLVVFFDLFNNVNYNQLMKIVPLNKIKQYIDNDQLQKLNSQPQKKQISVDNKMKEQKINLERPLNEKSQQSINVSPLLHHSILELISKNNLKEIQKILKTHKIPHTNYPQFVEKLEAKYLQYVQRTNPIYVLDELVHGKINLVQGLIDIYLKKRKYDHVDHFAHKYKLRGIEEPIKSKIFMNPLKHQDSFGPTESHVLNQRSQTHFLRLMDFDIPKTNVIWIDTLTIYQKPYTNHLKKLLFSKEIGLDSESSSAIHVFDKARLQIIQIYEPQTNVVLLFDVKDFKNDKKKRVRKNNLGQKKNKQTNSLKLANESQKNTQNQPQRMRKSFIQTIQLEQSEKKVEKNEDKNEKISSSNSQQDKNEDQDKTWFRFTKIIENVFKHSTIYGHVLHSDLGDIISELNLSLKPNELTIKDSQTQFKKYFPQQTKSKLSFLTEKCFGKEISKFEQCGAWDKRPLRCAQKHYAALDAVLPYKLVKWMEDNNAKKSA